jgi:lysophospholipase L1-like esterase
MSSSNTGYHYSYRPGARVNLHGIHYEINNLGLRDRPLKQEKSYGTRRVLNIGDSLTFGYGVRLEETFAKKLENLLNEEGTKTYESINFGVDGYSVSQELGFFKDKGFLLNPDLIILWLFIDDIYRCDYRFALGSRQGCHYEGIIHDLYTMLLSRWHTLWAVHAIGERGFMPWFREITQGQNGESSTSLWDSRFVDSRPLDEEKWQQFVRQLLEFQSLAKTISADFLVVNLPELNWQNGNYKFSYFNQAVKNFCQLHGIHYFDILPVLQKRDPQAYWYSLCDPHYNALAHSVVAETIYLYLQQTLLLPEEVDNRAAHD